MDDGGYGAVAAPEGAGFVVLCRVADGDGADGVVGVGDGVGGAEGGGVGEAEEEGAEAGVDGGEEDEQGGEAGVDMPVGDRPVALVAVLPGLVRLGVAVQVGLPVGEGDDDQGGVVDAGPAHALPAAVRGDGPPEASGLLLAFEHEKLEALAEAGGG